MIIDASVAVTWFTVEALHEEARASAAAQPHMRVHLLGQSSG